MATALQIHELRTAEGRVLAIKVEIDLWLNRRRLCKRIRTIPGATILRAPKAFSWSREEEFCEFSLAGVQFVVWEPFGDSDRYWIGPKDNAWHPEIGAVKEALSQHTEPRT
jgi:hypothetical protein